MGFELFRRRSRPVTDTPVIGIQHRGTVSLNSSAFALLKERFPKGAKGDIHIQWLYDKVRRMVALRPVSADTEDAYIVRKQPNAATYIATGKGFFQYFGIDADQLRHYELRPIDDHLVGFSLDADAVGSARPKPEPKKTSDTAEAGVANQPPLPEIPEIPRLVLTEPARRVFEVLKEFQIVTGEEIRERTGIDESALQGAMITLGTQLQKTTGRSLDAFFERRRVFRDGQRVKQYRRTKAGEKLIREAQVA